jgi:amino-acid N-acetyltransferase
MNEKNYVEFFRQTSPYIHAHRGKTFVIALSGDALLARNFHSMIHDIALLQSLGIRIVLVHGARPQINHRLRLSELNSTFVQNIRVTDPASMQCVKEAIGSTRFAIESELSMGLPDSPMHGSHIRVVGGNFITAKPYGVEEGIDFQRAGHIRRVDTTAINQQLSHGALVLISPIGFSPTGEAFNLSFQDIATHVAISLQAEKLIFISQASAIKDGEKILRSLSLPQLAELQETTKDSEHADLLGAASYACHGGVQRVHLVGYEQDGALLSELFTREGSGTLIMKQCAEIIRSANIEDVGGILNLIAPLEERSVLVKRSRELLENEISQFRVVVHPEGLIIGCAALYPTTNEVDGELACVAIHEEFHAQGIGARLLNQIEQDARNIGMSQLLVMTTKAAHWFLEKGFSEANIRDLPENKQSMYNYQRNARIFRKAI